MTDFEAQAKRTWFALRGSLSGAFSKGVLWVPARGSINDSWLRISTPGWTQEFRPHRLVWKATDQFMISGVGRKTRLERSVLRFKSQEDAVHAARAIIEIRNVEEVSLFGAREEIVAEARFHIQFHIPKSRQIIALVLVLGTAILVPRVLLFALISRITPATAEVTAWALIALLLVLLSLFLVGSRRTYKVWLSQEDHSILVRTGENYYHIVPTRVEWKESKTFILRYSWHWVELTFATVEEADKLVQLVKTSFPKLEIIHPSSTRV